MKKDTGVDRKSTLSAGFASVMGWSMDLYDLMLILYVAPVIGPLLIPADSTTLQLTFVYASFAVTLAMRPTGSVVFGIFADRHGRKQAMLVAITGVGVSTAAMGLVPTYAAAGVLAPLMFVLLRLVQGVFVGGVVVSTHTIGTETVSPRHRGLMAGTISGTGAGVGGVLASVVFLVLTHVFPGDEFNSLGWRVMFFSGLIAAALSIFIHRWLDESPMWEKSEDSTPAPRVERPFRTLLSPAYRPVFLANVLLVIGGAGIYYLTVSFFPTFFTTVIGLERSTSADLLIAAYIVVAIAGPIGGTLSDRIGRKRTFIIFGVLSLVIVCPLYLFLATLGPQQLPLILACSLVMSALVMVASAPMMAVLNERFPTSIRATGTGVSWNIGYAIGGMTPTLVTATSPEVSDITSRVTLVFAAIAVLFLIGAAIAPETLGRDLRKLDPENQNVSAPSDREPEVQRS